MRIYEFSKKLGIPTKDVLLKLDEGGFSVKNHMSALSQDAINFLYKQFDKKMPASKSGERKPGRQSVGAQKNAKQARVASAKTETVPEERTISISSKTVDEAAQALGRPVNEVIVTLLKWGIISNKNQVVADDIVKRLAEHYQVKTSAEEKRDEQVEEAEIKGENFKKRPPIVAILGHVDHGKTTLLDYIRKTRVAAKEKGGITQHLGAYEVAISQGKMIFLDTPGHEAFSKIRMRGVRAADIVVLVVAADDGIMPQTAEAIKFAKSLDVPIVVGVTKIDKAEKARVDVVKRQLAQHDLLPEDWGGQVVCVPLSGITGEGVDELLEMIVLQSQLMELEAEVSGPAIGYVLEAKIEKGRGPVATLISKHGNVRVGDYFTCGRTGGRVNSLVDSLGVSRREVGPAQPVQVAGFTSLAEAGDYFEVVEKGQYRKALARAAEKQRPARDALYRQKGALNLIVKADSDSSKEALVDAIGKLSKKTQKGFNIVSAGVGGVTESDVDLAANTGSRILAFHIKTEHNALLLAQQKSVKIHSFYIIYKLLEFLQELAEQEREIAKVRKKIGDAEVIRVFDIKGVGVIAGCRVTSGRFTQDGIVEVYRNKTKIGEGKIRSLQREKRSVKEVHSGFECGFLVDGFTDFSVGDIVHCFLEVPEK